MDHLCAKIIAAYTIIGGAAAYYIWRQNYQIRVLEGDRIYALNEIAKCVEDIRLLRDTISGVDCPRQIDIYADSSYLRFK